MKSREIICTTILSVLVYFAFSPQTRAACGSPDPGCPVANLAEGYLALGSLTTGTYNTGIGTYSLLSVTDGDLCTAVGGGTLFANTGSINTAVGAGALFSNTTAGFNTATGAFALFSNTTGASNNAFGDNALVANTSGFLNVAVGSSALNQNTTGTGNIAMGFFAGTNVTTGNNNIDFGNAGDAGDSDTIRIGNATHARIFIPAINNIVLGAGVSVTIDSTTGLLGIATSSLRFKQNIKPMDKSSEAILALKPVTFRYNQKIDPKAIPQFGLVAEDVEKVNPDLVVRDEEGKPYSVRYEAVNAMLLNEFLKEHRKVEQQERKIQEQECNVREQEATITQLKRDLGATIAQLTARLDEQTAQIQKVTAQLEASKATPQVVNNP
jgi:hypothetical protein